MAIGTVLAPIGLVLASFTTQIWQLYLTRGLMFGLGGSCAFASCVTLPSQWFYKNRGLATGIAVAGGGIGGVIFSSLTRYLITELGYRNALRVIALICFGALCLATGLLRSRWRPPPSTSQGFLGVFWDRSMATSSFAFCLVFSVIVTFSYMGPFFLAPSYVLHLSEDAQLGSVLLSIMCGMNAISRVFLGFVSDRLGKCNTLFICTLVAGLLVTLIWQYSNGYGSFTVFCVLYGLTGGGWVSLLPPLIAQIVGVKHIQRGLSLCYFVSVFGNLSGPPIIGHLQTSYGWTAAIQFTGAVTLVSSLIMLIVRFTMQQKVIAYV
ncbi:major facilitator superfamily domain-containing protein [Syncephalastrum racemosum]|uniref:Major facilitator superfamily domain-containing protein n=1 Tax=Syncephalastrum racemosum TaxID=13706 RepID=A0A1X2GZX5_SYNRA|nr:major facilitator superfamily domain-containing protein [Syncephalastrum racemosum]